MSHEADTSGGAGRGAGGGFVSGVCGRWQCQRSARARDTRSGTICARACGKIIRAEAGGDFSGSTARAKEELDHRRDAALVAE